MKLVIWTLLSLCLMFLFPYGYVDNNISWAGTLSSYSATATLANGDKVPVVIISGDTNGTINWYSLKELVSNNLNWTDIKRIGTQYGDHSGINWQSLGA